MLVNDDFHFVDARLEKKYFARKSRSARILQTDNGIECAIHGALYGSRHRNQVIDQCVVQNSFGKRSGSGHSFLLLLAGELPTFPDTSKDAWRSLRRIQAMMNNLKYFS